MNEDEVAAATRAAVAAIDPVAAARLLDLVVAVPSPSGHERDLAGFIVRVLEEDGITAGVQDLGGARANVLAEIGNAGRGPAYLMYGQLDTTFHGNAATDRVLTDGDPGPEFAPHPVHEGDWLLGLGAENPKGYLVAGITAVRALASAELPQASRVVLGLCGGGMPARPAYPEPDAIGFGVGVHALLDEAGPLDGALVPKPGFATAWEEVGIAIFEVTVPGELDYTGIRHRTGATNPILAAGQVLADLERWFAEYSAATETATSRPQGAVVAIRGGDPDRPAFSPATCTITVDLRIAPGMTVADVEQSFAAALDRIGRTHGRRLRHRLVVGVPGAATDPMDPIVRASVRAWEELTGRHHQPRTGTSGYTDASALRAAGVPTARVGMPRPAETLPGDSRFSMGRVHTPSMLVLTEWLVRTLVLLDPLETMRAVR